jgi:hypothetical protein
MDPNEGQIKRIVLKRMGRCRTCHRSYTSEDVSIVSRKPDMWMMIVECLDCHAKNFVAAVLNEGDPAQAELALRRMSAEIQSGTERVEPEREPTPSGERITAGDVVDMYAFLKEFDGDFIAHFRGRQTAQN